MFSGNKLSKLVPILCLFAIGIFAGETLYNTAERYGLNPVSMLAQAIAPNVDYNNGDYGDGGYGGVSSDVTPPTLSLVTPVTTPSADTTPELVFFSNESGTITYGGSCSSASTVASVGNNTVTFNSLPEGTYGDCTITVTDASSNISTPLAVTAFTITASGGGGSSGSGSGGGGGSSSSRSDDIDVGSVTRSGTSAIVEGEINEGSNLELYVVLSSIDRSPDCSNNGTQYVRQVFDGRYDDGDNFILQITGLDVYKSYDGVICAEDGRDTLESSVFDVSAEDNSNTPTQTNDDNTHIPPTTPVNTSVSNNFTFNNNISFNQPQFNQAADVRELQQFLNDFEGENLSVTGVYDNASNEAIKRFQRKYKREILDVWNLTDATGYVGITTRLKMNFLLKGQTAQCPVFTEYNGGLSGIMSSPEIGKTQEILRDLDMYTGSINNVWDSATNQALITFQETFREVMLDPWNITEGTGYKYKTTNKFLNYFAGCDTGSVYLEGVGEYEGI